ncbi:MAG: 23S rRNA (adenine(2503)-C(2))-methyltransferase RlmN [Thermodesulfobacteriota bacterium]
MKSDEKRDLLDFTGDELTEIVATLGEKPYRGAQIYSWIYALGVLDIDSMTDLSTEFREALKEGFSLKSPEVTETLKSVDGTIKFVTLLTDATRIESVIIVEDERVTLCVSTQAGCALDCAFCLTGALGAGRDLGLAEMSGQLFSARSLLQDGQKITNIVLMGMGEPLLNYNEVIKFVDILVDQKGFAFAPRRVTLSTAGIVPMIKRLGEDSSINLAVSLNATTDEVRSRLMPINKKYPLKKLVKALKEYPLSKSRHITIEYVLIGGVNDTRVDAKRLAGLLRGISVKINLIPYNPHEGANLKAPTSESVLNFKDILLRERYIAVIRSSKGADILAACGQLSQKGKANTK